jgi:predicted HTH domain antitoxin
MQRGFYERGEYERAEAIFRLLIDCFGDCADGCNYLGLIAYQRRRLDRAAAHFEKTVDLGRRLFPAGLAKKNHWLDLHTRPFMRGLRNLTMTRNEQGRYEEALRLCRRLAEECGDELTAAALRASILLNTGQWKAAAESAHLAGGDADSSEGFEEALARFELGEVEEALALFLRAALCHPRAARVLLGQRSAQPRSFDEARDNNAGVNLCRALYGYRSQPRRSWKFFGDLIKDPRVARLLDESMSAARAWHGDRNADRAIFERLQLIPSPAFARSEAHKLRDLMPTAHRDALHSGLLARVHRPGDARPSTREHQSRSPPLAVLRPLPYPATVCGMSKPLTLEIPGEVVEALRLPDREKVQRLRLELAVSLYSQGILGLGKTAQLAGLSRSDMNRVLAERQVSMHYGPEELAEDLQYGRGDQ